MSLGSVVLFQHAIAACPFEKDFDQVGSVAVVINNQDASLSIDPKAFRVEPGQENSSSGSRGKKSASITLFILFFGDIFLRA
jgi:hypothetical protein